MFHRLLRQSVATRLALSFGFVTLILLAQGATGFYAANRSQMLMQTVVADARERYDLAVELREQVYSEDLHMRQMAVLVDFGRINQEAGQVRQASTEIDRVLERLAGMPLTANERKDVDDVARLSKGTRTARDEVIRLAAAMQTDQANDTYERDLAEASQKRRNLAAQLAEQQKKSLDGALRAILGLADTARTATFASVVCALLFASLTGLLLYRAIMRPLHKAVALVDRIADGELAIQIDCDEPAEFGDMLRALDRMAQTMRLAVGHIRESAEFVMVASKQIAAGNSDLSARTESQSSALQSAVSSLTQISNTVQRNAEAVENADRLAMQAATAAIDGGDQVNALVASIQGLASSSRRVSEIVQVIEGIAYQTNLLALNAAVEAARAGESGRGFAVVANEVRTLAHRSSDAAKEINALILANLNTADASAALATRAGAKINELVGASERVTAVVAEIATASAEQAKTVQSINVVVSQIDQGLQQNAALVEQSAAAADSLSAQTVVLNDAVRKFRVIADEGPDQADEFVGDAASESR